MAFNTAAKIRQTVKLQSGPRIGSVAKQLANIEKIIEPQLQRLAISYYEFVKLYINVRRKRAVNNQKKRLSSAFKTGYTKFSKTGLELGLGDVDFLDSEFPYWKMLNYGGLISAQKVPGWFGRRSRPVEGKAGGKDIYHYHPYDGANFMMTPKVPMEGIHYLEAADRWTKKQWSSAWRAFKRKLEHNIILSPSIENVQ